ncbi:hypothetical protein [Bisbaumannia pacifica]|uniref:Uncharacterized protein n=1 Tax=Bisbaumannia pacifica TaxID=77098 RepID=A0ABD4KWX1_9GAMM|nr:hypothetical protein [Halomonas pacifica]MBH8578788.1 hypothetical protein [Halomonas pacifica]
MAEIDAHSETWRAVADWARERRQAAADDLIRGGTTPGHDDKLRGEIRALDDLLSLVDTPQSPAATPIDY